MLSASTIAQSGLQAAQQQLDASAHNVANLQTEGFRRQEVVQQAAPAGGVQTEVRTRPLPGEALASDLVTQMRAAYSFDANLKTIQTEDRMLGRLLDARA